MRKKITRYIPVAVFVIGVLFILRGLGLGIPFLSPPERKMKIPDKTQTEHVMGKEELPDRTCCQN